MSNSAPISPRLIAHGGAGEWTYKDHDQALAALRDAVAAGWKVLSSGGSALDAVEQTVIKLEDSPLFDAGVGSYLNENGEVEMDALIADGPSLKFGAVAAVQRVKNPISLAKLVMTQTENCFFVAKGAEQLAVELGLKLVPNLEFITDVELDIFRKNHHRAEKHGTVGAAAIDAAGKLAAATSTGGMPFKKPGRVGDSPIFGAGGYADEFAASSGTGRGEDMMRLLLCRYVVDQVGQGLDAQSAVNAAIKHYHDRIAEPDGGLILVDRNGKLGAGHTTRLMPIAWVDSNGEIQSIMRARDAVLS